MIRILSRQVKYTGVTLDNPYTAVVPEGITAVIGNNGGGKTAFATIIESGWNYMTNHIESDTGVRPRVKSIAFGDLHALTGFTSEYYQQRYESMMNDDVPTVAALLGDKVNSPLWHDVSKKLNFERCLDKRVNYLSSGELRKLLIMNMLFETPDLLILDNPYIGLDVNARAVIDETIQAIAARGTSIMLLVCDVTDIPESVTAVIPITDMTIHGTVMRRDFDSIDSLRHNFDELFDFRYDRESLDYIIDTYPVKPRTTGECIVEMNHCKVRYGSRTLIDDVQWTINQGECWALTGANGSGKSTLLSLINADNPQAYSNDIRLFGRKRGTGESIWDIKRRIGFLSAEYHLYYRDGGATVAEIVSGSLKDSPADFGALSDDKTELRDRWLKVFGMDKYSDSKYRHLSFGRQRLVLLIAAIAKMPDLLILDEPLHGLDQSIKRAVIEIIDLMASMGVTLIYVTHCVDELPKCITHSKHLSSQHS